MHELRTFNPSGIAAFRGYLQKLREDPASPPPFEILTEPSFTKGGEDDIYLDRKTFANAFEAVEYMTTVLTPIKRAGFYYDTGLWSWLSLYYFDMVCPANADGARKPGRDFRHISDKSHYYRHRHLLAGKLQAYDMYGDKAKLLIGARLDSQSKLHQELTSRQSLISNPGVVELARSLYYDPEKEAPKRGAQSGGSPGNIYRYVNIIQQLDLTYDLYSMGGEEISALLPPEFDRWKD